MDEKVQPESLLNVFEVVTDGVHRHLICFLKPSRAGQDGIDHRAVVGEFKPGPENEFNTESFELNPAFLDALAGYMNVQATRAEDLIREAKANVNGWLYILDPRGNDHANEEPMPGDLLGRFQVDESGAIVPNSFAYNGHHVFFDEASGVSGVLYDRQFYDWLHAQVHS